MILYDLEDVETVREDDPTESQEKEEEDDDEVTMETKESMGLMTMIFYGPILGILLILSILVLISDRKYSLACGAWWSPSRFFSRTWLKRFFILVLATLIVSMQVDAVTLLCYFGILYCTIFHDILWRTKNCPEDKIAETLKELFNLKDTVNKYKQELQATGKQILDETQKALRAAYERAQKIYELSMELCNTYMQNLKAYGDKLTTQARATLSTSYSALKSKVQTVKEAMQTKSVDLIDQAIDSCNAALQNASALTTKFARGVFDYFIPSKERTSAKAKELGLLKVKRREGLGDASIGGVAQLFRSSKSRSVEPELVEQAQEIETIQLFEPKAIDEGRLRRERIRAENPETDETKLGWIQWATQKLLTAKNDTEIKNDELDKQLALNLGFKDASELPADLPERVILHGQWEPGMQRPTGIQKSKSKSKSKPLPFYAPLTTTVNPAETLDVD
jgi:hypothetical protein